MSEWKKVKLGDVSDIFSGYAFKSKDMNNNCGTPLIKIKNINDFIVSTECDSFLNLDIDLSKWEKYRLQINDFLIAMTGQGSVGRVGKMMNYSSIYFVNQRVAIVRPNCNLVNPYFLYKIFATNERQLELFKKANGAGQPNISPSQIGDVEFYIPNIKNQHRIATILSRYDSLIENYQKQIKLLEESAQRLYKEWFIDLRFPGHENTKIVDGVPEGWEKKTIFELGKVITGKTPSTANKANYGGDIPFITIPDMHSGIYPISSQTLSKQGAESQLGKYIPENSLMVSCIGTAGLVCISETLCQTNQQINSLVLDNDIKLYYMYFTFLSLKEHLNNIGSNGATMTNVNKSKFENIEVVVPVDSLLDTFNLIANNTFAKIKNLSYQIRHLTEARDRLLPKLMSGEIKIN